MKLKNLLLNQVSFLFKVLVICLFSSSVYAQDCNDDTEVDICNGSELVLQAVLYTDVKFIEENFSGNQEEAFSAIAQGFHDGTDVYRRAIPNLSTKVEEIYVLEDPELIAQIEVSSPSQLVSFLSNLSAFTNQSNPCPNVDIVLYYTGYNIGVNGAYFSKGLCNSDNEPPLNNYKKPAGIIRGGSNINVNTTAHEVGHMLGLIHIDNDELQPCSACCLENPRPVMCSGGTAVSDPTDFFITDCNMVRLENLPCDCLMEQTLCDHCDITMEDKTSPQVYEYTDCDAPEEIEYTIEVCNDCYAEDYKIIAKNFDPTIQQVLTDGVFKKFVEVNKDWYITNPISFEPEECKEFKIRTIPSEPNQLESELQLTFDIIEKDDTHLDFQINSVATKVKVIKNIGKIKSKFHFEDNLGNTTYEFCETDDIFVDGSASEFEDEFRFKIWRTPVGTTNYDPLFLSSWYVGDIDQFPLTQIMNSNGHPIEAGYKYKVRMDVRNSCNPTGNSKNFFTVVEECCPPPSWFSCFSENGETFLTWDDNSPSSEYIITVDLVNSCCGIDDQEIPQGEDIDGNIYKIPKGKYSCLEWWVVTKCGDTFSAPSASQCYYKSDPCFSFLESGIPMNEKVDMSLHQESEQIESVSSVSKQSSLSESDFTIAPNPFSSEIVIHFQSSTDGNYVFELFDLAGRRVHTQNHLVSEGINTAKLLIDNNLRNGVYALHIIDEKGGRMTKLIAKME